MRLWHKDLITVLPRQQLLGQWRELCAIMRNVETKGTPNHVLVNKVMDYPGFHLYMYAKMVHDEMAKRGYKCDFSKFRDVFVRSCGEDSEAFTSVRYLFHHWHNDRYLRQCLYNLQEKHDCGAITDEEWQKIEERCKDLIWYVI